MQITTLDKLIWKLILGGMLVFSVGWFIPGASASAGVLEWLVWAAGAMAVVAGVVLFFVRARMPD